MNIYSQSTGHWWDDRGELIATGYSGHGDSKNSPKQQAAPNLGPIPRGLWVIGDPYDSVNVGPFALPLTPSGHTAFGRTAFLVHGDSIKDPGTASRGCIILPRQAREQINKQNDRILKVVA
jgi:hypothetical protein